MGFLDRLLGRKEERPQGQPGAPTYRDPNERGQQAPDADEQALQRYRYMLKTAPPEKIEQAHEEAFAKLTSQQRAQALRELAEVTPEGERASISGGSDDPKSLARLATRAEMRQPGVMERIFGGTGRGAGMGGMMGGMGGTLLGSLAAGFVGSMIAREFFDSVGGFGEGNLSGQPVGDTGDYGSSDFSSGDSGNDDYASGDSGSADSGGGDYSSGDSGSYDSGGYSDEDPGGYGDDLGGDSGSDWGGDWGGGDWGDLGGGDW